MVVSLAEGYGAGGDILPHEPVEFLDRLRLRRRRPGGRGDRAVECTIADGEATTAKEMIVTPPGLSRAEPPRGLFDERGG